METHSISWLWIGDTVLQVILAVLNGKTACKEQSLGVQALVRPRGGTRVSMHARNTSDGFSLHLILNSEILHCCQNFPKPDLQLRGPVWGHRLEYKKPGSVRSFIYEVAYANIFIFFFTFCFVFETCIYLFTVVWGWGLGTVYESPLSPSVGPKVNFSSSGLALGAFLCHHLLFRGHGLPCCVV